MACKSRFQDNNQVDKGIRINGDQAGWTIVTLCSGSRRTAENNTGENIAYSDQAFDSLKLIHDVEILVDEQGKGDDEETSLDSTLQCMVVGRPNDEIPRFHSLGHQAPNRSRMVRVDQAAEGPMRSCGGDAAVRMRHPA